MSRSRVPGPLLILLTLLVLAAASPALASDPRENTTALPNGADLPAEFVTWARVATRTYFHETPNGRRILLLDAYNTWLGVDEQRWVNGELWYRTTSNRWVYADDMKLPPVTKLQGYYAKGTERGQLGFIMTDGAFVSDAPFESGRVLGRLSRYAPLDVTGKLDGWLRVGADRWVHSEDVRLVHKPTRPEGIGSEDKWIDVNLRQQTVAAYEGDKLVFATLASTGKDPTPTITGLYHVYEKKIGEFMAGGWADGDPYVLEEVPWTMYFTQRYALHGAYWHDDFGATRSHGCVNLSPADSKFLFTWSGPVIPAGKLKAMASPDNLGTWVYVHD